MADELSTANDKMVQEAKVENLQQRIAAVDATALHANARCPPFPTVPLTTPAPSIVPTTTTTTGDLKPKDVSTQSIRSAPTGTVTTVPSPPSIDLEVEVRKYETLLESFRKSLHKLALQTVSSPSSPTNRDTT